MITTEKNYSSVSPAPTGKIINIFRLVVNNLWVDDDSLAIGTYHVRRATRLLFDFCAK